jgi:Na+/glutamate symporter
LTPHAAVERGRTVNCLLPKPPTMLCVKTFTRLEEISLTISAGNIPIYPMCMVVPEIGAVFRYILKIILEQENYP